MCFLCDEHKSFAPELIENLKSDYPDKEKLDSLLEIFEGKWDELDYNIKEVSLFHCAIEFIKNTDLAFNVKFLSGIAISVTPKDKKKGRSGILMRFFRNYHKEKVRKLLLSYFIYFRNETLKKEIESIENKENLKENIETILEKSDVVMTLWSLLQLNEKEILSFYKEEFTKYYIVALIEMYICYEHYEFKTIMENPGKLKGDCKNVDTKQLYNENKSLKLKMGKIKKEETMLKQTVYELNKETKQLKGEIFKLYEESLKEIERLKKEKENERLCFERERKYLLSIIEDLSIEHDNEKSQNTCFDLKGKKICVIGGNKNKQYEEVVSKFNGKIEFVSADDYKKIKGAVSRCDTVFFLTELVGHKHFREAIKAADENKIPFHYINSKGRTSFERSLKEYVENSAS